MSQANGFSLSNGSVVGDDRIGFYTKIKHHVCPKLFPNTLSPSVPTPDHSITVQTFSTVKSTTAVQKKRTSFCQEINRLHVRTENTALMF